MEVECIFLPRLLWDFYYFFHQISKALWIEIEHFKSPLVCEDFSYWLNTPLSNAEEFTDVFPTKDIENRRMAVGEIKEKYNRRGEHYQIWDLKYLYRSKYSTCFDLRQTLWYLRKYWKQSTIHLLCIKSS